VFLIVPHWSCQLIHCKNCGTLSVSVRCQLLVPNSLF
jgi:hypothetical protein